MARRSRIATTRIVLLSSKRRSRARIVASFTPFRGVAVLVDEGEFVILPRPLDQALRALQGRAAPRAPAVIASDGLAAIAMPTRPSKRAPVPISASRPA